MRTYTFILDRDRNCEAADHVGSRLMLKGTRCAMMPVRGPGNHWWRYVCFGCVCCDETERETFSGIQPYKNQSWSRSIAEEVQVSLPKRVEWSYCRTSDGGGLLLSEGKVYRAAQLRQWPESCSGDPSRLPPWLTVFALTLGLSFPRAHPVLNYWPK
jgi:hypothetical protein